MKKVLNKVMATTIAAAAVLMVGCSKDDNKYETPQPGPIVNAVIVEGAGDSATVVVKVNQFRLLAGDPLNNAPGVTGGRREVNWDAVPPAFTNSNNFPFDFFGSADQALGNGRKRGLILANTGTSFRVDSTDFADIDASYAGQFEAFSRKRLFTYLGNNITEVTFKVPGTNSVAFVKGFGVIFSDVDDANSTNVEYFAGTKSLGKYKAKANAQGFSFVGVSFPDDKVTSVKITSGNGVLGAGIKDISSGGTKDLVVMDDFFYDEPKPLN